MKSTCKNRTLQWISKQISLGNISFSHKLQRKEGQWNRQTKSELIDSLLRNYPINPTYGIVENDITSIIDGVQRISTVRDYLADAFALAKTLEPVIIKVNGVEEIFDIAGKKFSKLDEEIKDILFSSELQMYELTDCTEKDVKEIFKRQNAGKSLNNTQLRTVVMSDEMSDIIYSISSHNFFNKILTDAQKRKDLERDIVIETLMLIETSTENDYACFANKNINDFIQMYQKNINKDKIEILIHALDKLDESFDEVSIKQLNIPMILFVSYRCIKDKKSFAKLVETIENFISDYNDENKLQDYKQYCSNGTSSSENVRGRFEYWRGVIKTL